MEQQKESSPLPFHDRLSYIAWRLEWKGAYKQLAEEIRETKKRIKAAPSGSDAQAGAQSTRHYQRVEANGMMVTLEQAKTQAVEARRQLKHAA